MSHYCPPTPAPVPRHGTPPVTRRLALFLLVFLSLAAGAPFAAAEMVYYTEDFTNDGEPGFDPMFNHEITEPVGLPAIVYPTWRISELDGSLGLFYGTLDRVTFNLSPGESVEYAAVEIPAHYWRTAGDVTFIGTDGTWQTSGDDYGKTLLEVSSSQIGTIQAIELYGLQLGCGSITIGTIPEPRTCLMVVCGALGCVWLRMSGRRVG